MPQESKHDGLRIGTLTVFPAERVLTSGVRKVSLEPLVMRLFLGLVEQAGQVVARRDLFRLCWGSSPVSDDSLNRLVLALRKCLGELRATVFVETVPGTGYVLKLDHGQRGAAPDEADGAVQEALDSWRLGLPQPNHICLELLRAAAANAPTDPRLWGWIALLLRHAAEYGPPGEIARFTSECEKAARQALALDPSQPEARVALATIIPLFREWAVVRQGLEQVLNQYPDHLVATQDLATLEMATGRVSEGKRIRDGLIDRDPLAAVTCYKSVYQHWSVGDIAGMDRVAERAIHLWPTHPAVWTVRLWTHAYAGRLAAALAMIVDGALRPEVPPPMLGFLRTVLRAVGEGTSEAHRSLVAAGQGFAAIGPSGAVSALIALGLIDAVDEQFAVLDAYYLHEGHAPVPSRHSSSEMALNEQHRRLTQVLFTPALSAARGDPRFMVLCERIGLVDYWTSAGLTPDFLHPAAA